MMSAFLLLNLFIGVITASMEDAKEEMYRRKKENARLALSLRLRGKVRKTTSWARSWANFSLLQLYSPGMHVLTCIFWANLTPFSLKAKRKEKVASAGDTDGDAAAAMVE
jgi:hypothetical protein